MAPLVLLLSDDLLDISRIQGHARNVGCEVVPVRDLPGLLGQVARRPTLCLVDLTLARHDLERVVEELAAVRCPVVAFGPHVDASGLKAARQAGCLEALPRSVFFEELEAHLTRWRSAAA